MPRPRHPIREHFHEIAESSRKNGAIGCNYCGKEQSAGNPKRCQKHLDECTHYAQVLAALESGDTPSFSLPSPFESPAQNQADDSPHYATSLNTPSRTNENNHFTTTPHSTPSTSMGDSPVPLSASERMNESSIMHTLHIEEAVYSTMEREFDAQMISLNLSGAGLLTNSGMKLLKQVFIHMNGQFPDILQRISAHDKRVTLTSMAYICNHKRRNGEVPNLPTPPSSSVQRKVLSRSVSRSQPNTPGITIAPMFNRSNSQEPSQLFGLTTIIAERAEPGGSFVVCRPSDLIQDPKEPESITVNDVKFIPFISLLRQDDDVLFNATNDDKIVYTFTGGRTKTVSNEIVWRVALEEMHKKGMNPFVFKIYKHHPGGTM